MPEAPDLEVVKDFLNERVSGRRIEAARVVKPSVVRSLAGDLATELAGLTIEVVERRGKFLLFRLSQGHVLSINPMLTGVLQYCGSGTRAMKRTCVVLSLEGDDDLRYLDDKQMGMFYLVRQEQLGEVPRLGDQGPDVLDELPFEEFVEGLRPFHGEIKGILTRGRFVSGIGNAYSDEILFEAGIYPFKRRKAITEPELRRLHASYRTVVLEAIGVLRGRVGERIHIKVRDFLKVHNRGGQPCPRCGGNISQITANRRITSYCRACQPGMLIRN